MEDMTEANAEITPVEIPITEPSPSERASENSDPVVEKKKRGRKPKAVTPPPTPVPTAPKPRKKKVAVKPSKGDRALAAAVESAQLDRIKVIDELSKIKEAMGVKQSKFDALEWKIGMLTGNPSSSMAPSQPQPVNATLHGLYSQPPAYPAPSAPPYMPPGMRTPSLPHVPMAAGGAIEGAVEPQADDEDQFLKGSGVMGGKWA